MVGAHTLRKVMHGQKEDIHHVNMKNCFESSIQNGTANIDGYLSFMYGICSKVIKMKQAKLTEDLQETYRKKIKTAIDIEKRKNDLFQYIDTKGMENFVVLLAGFFLEKTKDYPEQRSAVQAKY